MTKAVTFARQIAVNPAECARVLVVVTCATALILAERALPLL